MGGESFMPLFFGDFLSSTADWDNEERGAYLLLLGHQWTLGSLPNDEKTLAKLCAKHGHNFRKMWPKLSQKFIKRDDGRLINLRLEEHRAKHMSVIERKKSGGRLGALKRWGQVDSHGSPNGSANRTPNDTIPNHTNKKKEETPPTPLAGGDNLLDKKPAVTNFVKPKPELPDYPPELNRDAWHMWTNYRTQIRKPIRAPSIQAAIKNMVAIGDAAAQQAAVDRSIANGWQGLFASDSRVVSGKRSVEDIRRELVGDEE